MAAVRMHVGRIFLICVTVLCFGLGLIYKTEVQSEKGAYMLYTNEVGISESDAMQMHKTEKEQEIPIDFAVWGLKKNNTVINQSLNRNISMNVLMICGKPELLFDINGYLDAEDYEGCLLDKKTAYALFGGTNIIGQKVQYDQKEYIVRGILKNAENTMVIQANSKAKAEMDTVVVDIPKSSRAENVVTPFINRHGLSVNKIDYSQFAVWSELLMSLMPICMLIAIFIPILRAVFKQRYQPFFFIICVLGVGILCVLFFKISGIQLKLPEDFIPTRWSDFSFWSRTFESKKEEIMTLITIEKREPERIVLEPFMQVVKYSIFSTGLYIVFLRKIRLAKISQVYIYMIGCIAAAFAAVVLNKENGEALSGNVQLWYIFIFYFLLTYLYECRFKILGGFEGLQKYVSNRQQYE